MPKAIVRQEVEKLSGVSRTWYEYTWENDAWLPILVVEVDFNTDPNAYNDFRPPVLDEISHAVIDTLEKKTAARISYIRIVPKVSAQPSKVAGSGRWFVRP